MAKVKTYYEQRDQDNALLLRKRLESLPPFAVEFFRAIYDTTSSNTRTNYAYDLGVFFEYLCSEEQDFKNTAVTDFTIEDLRRVTVEHIENYMDYITYYEKQTTQGPQIRENHERGKSRKFASIRTMFSYFYKKRKLDKNPAELIDFPKIHEKNIVRLEIDEVARLLDEVESGEKLTPRQQKWHAYTKVRDLAIISFLLGTGMRVSELVGIDITDLDFNVNGVTITRKGGNQVMVYFGHEVRQALQDYLVQRSGETPAEGHENALFLSMHRKRLTTRAIQNLVKKYAKLVTTAKNISPHKLRSTYGTTLYNETGDIYLVADVLGHSDVNTTRKHYAQLQDSRRRQAARYVTLRQEEER